jgi:hypothetical protein
MRDIVFGAYQSFIVTTLHVHNTDNSRALPHLTTSNTTARVALMNYKMAMQQPKYSENIKDNAWFVPSEVVKCGRCGCLYRPTTSLRSYVHDYLLSNPNCFLFRFKCWCDYCLDHTLKLREDA